LGGGAAGSASLFVPDVMVVNIATRSSSSSSKRRRSSSNSSSSSRQLTLECKTLLPQLCTLLASHLDQVDQQQQAQELKGLVNTAATAAGSSNSDGSNSSSSSVTTTSSSGSTSSSTAAASLSAPAEANEPHSSAAAVLGTSTAVGLLQQLAALHSNGNLGPADPQLVACLVDQHLRVQECSLQGELCGWWQCLCVDGSTVACCCLGCCVACCAGGCGACVGGVFPVPPSPVLLCVLSFGCAAMCVRTIATGGA
jgi:hypothetical protein